MIGKSNKPLTMLTAGDVMSREMILLHLGMTLTDSAKCFREHEIRGAPVVDGDGACIGVLTASDFVKLALIDKPTEQNKCDKSPPIGIAMKATFAPPGETVAPGRDRSRIVVDTEPPSEGLGFCQPESVRDLMTKDPVMVATDELVTSIVRKMVNAHIHRVIVVDSARRPIGIVTSTDILAATCHGDLFSSVSR